MLVQDFGRCSVQHPTSQLLTVDDRKAHLAMLYFIEGDARRLVARDVHLDSWSCAALKLFAALCGDSCLLRCAAMIIIRYFESISGTAASFVVVVSV